MHACTARSVPPVCPGQRRWRSRPERYNAARVWDTSESKIARYHAYRAQLEHEDHLIGVRVGWLITSEAFLFAAFATAVPYRQHHQGAVGDRLLELLPLLGITVAVLVYCAVLASLHATERLRKACPNIERLGYPPVVSPNLSHVFGFVPARFIPPALILAWIYVVI